MCMKVLSNVLFQPDTGPMVERFKHTFKTKGQGTPKKGTPKKKSGTPKRPTPKRGKRPILTEEQMKNQRRITDMFSQKRKLESIIEDQASAGTTSPKRPCLNSLDNSLMARTPQKFQPTLHTLLQSKIKQETQSPATRPPLNASLSSAGNKSTDVISLVSDDDDEENIKPPSSVKR